VIICIPTKGRPKTKTYKLFNSAGFEVYHFIEPQDIDSYDVPNMVSIEKNDQGIGYARNFILQFAKDKKWDLICQCDDDVNSFGYVKNNKSIKSDASIFNEMLPIIDKMPFELYGMSFRQFAWGEKNKYSINSKTFTCCTIIKVNKIKWKYANTFMEDIQFNFESIRYGSGCFKFNHFFFNTPAVGTNTGGCYDGYKRNEDKKSFNFILNKYLGYTKVVMKKKTHDIKWDIKGWAKKFNRKIL
jgi:hypothetical protein